ncbi:MAG: hypothetical protein RL701_652 [Pseudomonadota bacterium]
MFMEDRDGKRKRPRCSKASRPLEKRSALVRSGYVLDLWTLALAVAPVASMRLVSRTRLTRRACRVLRLGTEGCMKLKLMGL